MEPAPQSNATLRDMPVDFLVALGMPAAAGIKVAEHTVLNDLLGPASVREQTNVRVMRGPCSA
jgi:hypothetical protein